MRNKRRLLWTGISGLLILWIANPGFALEWTRGLQVQSPVKITTPMSSNYSNLPIHFEVNEGQTDASVKFLSRGPGYALFLTPNEAVMALKNTQIGQIQQTSFGNDSDRDYSILRIRFEGSKPNPEVHGKNLLPTQSHYLKGNRPSQWRRNIANYAHVEYQQLYPGIDLLFYGNQQKLEYDFVVAPGSSPEQIRLKFSGPDRLMVDPKGNLILDLDGNALTQKAPVIYQVIDGNRRTIEGSYRVLANNTVQFEVGTYDRQHPLIIDPVLSYSTFYGGTDVEQAADIALDPDNNVLIVGNTFSTTFPTVAPFQSDNAGDHDVIVAKLSEDGSTMLFATYLGGSLPDFGTGIASDDTGAIYLTGYTGSSDFPTTADAFDESQNGKVDAFFAKLDSAGTALTFSSFIGGKEDDMGRGIAVDSDHNIYLTGTTRSGNWPVDSAFEPFFKGDVDGYVTKIASAGDSLVYSTFIGSFGQEAPQSIATDSEGNAYVIGSTTSLTFPTSDPSYQVFYGGGSHDAFFTRYNADGIRMYASLLGGNKADFGDDIVAGESGDAYLVGHTNSPNFPLENALQSTKGSFADAWVGHVSETGNPDWLTFLGGNGQESGFNIDMNSDGDVIISGESWSSDYPTEEPIQEELGNGPDVVVTQFNSDGDAILFSTYLGGDKPDINEGLAVDSAGNIYVAGFTGSTDYPTENALQDVFGGDDWDIFVSKISPRGENELLLTEGPEGDPNPVHSEGAVRVSVTAEGIGDKTYEWTADCSAWNDDNGTFDDNTLQNPEWTAPLNDTGGTETCTIAVTVEEGELVGNGDYEQEVESIEVITITEGPEGDPNPVDTAGDVNVSVTADVNNANDLAYSWTADCSGWSGEDGAFDDDTAEDPNWTAPDNDTGDTQSCEISVTVDDGDALSETASYTQEVFDTFSNTVSITIDPAGNPNPVGSGEVAAVTVTAEHSAGGDLTFSWTADCSAWSGDNGTFDDATVQNPNWTAPENAGSSTESCTMSVTASGDDAKDVTASYTQEVDPAPTIEITEGPAGTPNPVDSEKTVEVSVDAEHSADDDADLNYSWSADCSAWSASNGVFDNASAESPQWTAPENNTEITRTCEVSVTVDDGNGLEATGSYNQTVNAKGTLDITFGPLGFPNPVDSEEDVSLLVQAKDSNNNSLTYLWEATCSTLADNGAFDDATLRKPVWTAPLNDSVDTQECDMEVTVDNGDGLTETGLFTQKVKSGRTIEFTEEPESDSNPVAPEGSVEVTVTAESSIDLDLTYEWTSACLNLDTDGIFGENTIQSPTWTAPNNDTGVQQSCVITVEVSDGELSEKRSFVQSVRSIGSLIVTPLFDKFVVGREGGPFTPDSIKYLLINVGGTSVDYSTSNMEDWTEIVDGEGSIDPDDSAVVEVLVNEEAEELEEGTFSDHITFTNDTNGLGTTDRNILLFIGQKTPRIKFPRGGFHPACARGFCFRVIQKYVFTNSGQQELNYAIFVNGGWLDLEEEGEEENTDARVAMDQLPSPAGDAKITGHLQPGESASFIARVNKNAQNVRADNNQAMIVVTDANTNELLDSDTITLEVAGDAFEGVSTNKVYSPFWQADPTSYTFIAVSHPSLSGMNSEIGMVVNAVTSEGQAYSMPLEFTISADATRQVFIVSTNNPVINPGNFASAGFIIGTTAPTHGQVVVQPLAANTNSVVGPSGTPGRGFPDITMLNYWGAVVVQSTATGFAMEWIGDMQDSRSVNTPNVSGVN